ncbi:MAG TPA: hypothetical protein VGI86_01065 [Acidimicrobiia bacterium]
MSTPAAQGGGLTAVAVVTRLATRISEGDGPLGVIADALTELAAALAAERVVVAVDDARLGRQVFTSARAPLGVEPIGLFGAPGIWTEPAELVDRLPRNESELLRASIGAAVHALPHNVPASHSPDLPTTRESRSASAGFVGAVARAREHGWSFTLALVRFDDGDHSPARIAGVWSGLRPGDTADAAPAGFDAITVLLPATRDDEAAAILATAIRRGGLPRCAFGLIRCPADADEPTRLLALARQRLTEAIAARDPSTHSE